MILALHHQLLLQRRTQYIKVKAAQIFWVIFFGIAVIITINHLLQ